jgi:hypothetical protein
VFTAPPDRHAIFGGQLLQERFVHELLDNFLGGTAFQIGRQHYGMVFPL